MEQFLNLSDKKPLFEGLTRSVFVYEQNPDYLIKVPSPAWKKRIARLSPWRRFRKSVDFSSPNTRELREYIHNFPIPKQANHHEHLMQIVGVIATDIGWGLIVKAERDQFGNYAKPLGHYQNDIPHYKKEISEFISWVLSTTVVCYDLKFDNILLSWRNGKSTLVLIDGIGDNRILPIRHWCLKYNTKQNKLHLRQFTNELREFIDLSSLTIS